MKKHVKVPILLLMICMIVGGMLCLSIASLKSYALPLVVLNKRPLITIEKGQSIVLTVRGAKKKIKWSSKNKKIATVNQKGKVVAKKIGTTKITAKIGKKTYTCKIKIVKPKQQIPQTQETDTSWKPREERIIGDYAYILIEDGSVMISSYNGTNANVIIPSEVEGHPVKCIGDNVFKNNSTIVSITIPECITQINGSVCQYCPNLTSVIIPPTVKEIRYNSFLMCPNLTVSVYKKSCAHYYCSDNGIRYAIIE